MEIVRNLLRRKVRAGLTLFGIVIGVFALVVMGAMSEYFSVLLDGAERISGANIDVSPINRDVENRLNPATLRKLRRIDGVRLAVPSLQDLLEPTQVTYSVPEMVIGIEPEFSRIYLPGIGVAGRWLERGDDRQAVIGSDVARKRHLQVGDTITWREEEFRIVGVIESTKTTPDFFVYMPFERFRKVMKLPTSAISNIDIVPDPGVDPNALAATINSEVPRVKARPPKELIDEVRQSLVTYQAVMISGALLAAVVGGLSVMNTMIMSVYERTREIGIKKAVGATTLDIILEYLAEAAMIGAVGGVVGVVLGWLAVTGLNAWAAPSMGVVELWLATPRLLVGALLFAVVVGAGAGLYPAWSGARLEVVQALRAE